MGLFITSDGITHWWEIITTANVDGILKLEWTLHSLLSYSSSPCGSFFQLWKLVFKWIVLHQLTVECLSFWLAGAISGYTKNPNYPHIGKYWSSEVAVSCAFFSSNGLFVILRFRISSRPWLLKEKKLSHTVFEGSITILNLSGDHWLKKFQTSPKNKINKNETHLQNANFC